MNLSFQPGRGEVKGFDEEIVDTLNIFNYSYWKAIISAILGGSHSIKISKDLIVVYRVMENQSDSEMVKPIAEELASRYDIRSWIFDKGYWHKENKALLESHVDKVIMPKKGKCNKLEQAEENHRS